MVEYSDNEEYRPLVNELLTELLLKLPNNVLIDNDIICTPFYNNMLSSKKFSFSLFSIYLFFLFVNIPVIKNIYRIEYKKYHGCKGSIVSYIPIIDSVIVYLIVVLPHRNLEGDIFNCSGLCLCKLVRCQVLHNISSIIEQRKLNQPFRSR